MTCVVTTARTAEDDIADAASYIALDSPISSQRFGEEILLCFQRIAQFPESGQRVISGSVNFRRVRVSTRFDQWLVYFRMINADTIEVVRVLHGRRDIAALLREMP
ncbi:MAG: type II toxin-antitoxin system RelE/ParE family toxin [Proteobacteria bacterium]|nr:type II toxin-antitoxin system RelE/ParE family toxin [Pseudomonadota bacterium]